MKYLTKKDIANNTIIIFMSDNGGLSLSGARGKIAHVQNLPLRAGKGSLYEGGIRVPMIVKWPEVVKSNTTINQYVIAEDFFPSIIHMAGITNFKTIQKYKFGKTIVEIKNYLNLSSFKKYSNKDIFAVISGSLVDKFNKKIFCNKKFYRLQYFEYLYKRKLVDNSLKWII